MVGLCVMTGQPLQRDPTLSARSRGQRLGQSLLSTGHTLAGKQRVIAGRRSDPAAITLFAADARECSVASTCGSTAKALAGSDRT